MLERFNQHLIESGLVPPNTRVLVGYSGGADSTCLLHLLTQCGVDVVAAHLHHGQRDEADDELARCQLFADTLNVPFIAGRADVPLIARQFRIGLEEAGRQARYSFFDQAALQSESSLIATAHTLSDHSETVLLHLARGTGLAGLAGIPERRDNLIRPLLSFRREETRAYCQDLELWFHDDPANSDVNFSRARIRHRVLPEIRALNPAADSAIARLANIVSEEDQFLNGMAAAALEQSDVPLNGDLGFLTLDAEIAIDQAKLLTLPPVLVKRGVRLLAEALGATLTYDQTLLLVAGLTAQPNGSITAEGGNVVMEWDGEVIHARSLQADDPFRFPLTVPGETLSEEFGWQFAAYESNSQAEMPSRTNLVQQFNPAAIKGSLYFRSAKPGEKIQPTGFSGRRLISDLLSEAGLTAIAKQRIPVLCDMVGPLWIPGVCPDERGRLSPGLKSALTIRFEASEGSTTEQRKILN